MRLLYFAPVAWDGYEQRPHYVARHFLAQGGQAVRWVNPYPARLPAWRDVTRTDLRQPSLRLDRPAGLSVADVGGWPLDPLPGGSRLNHALFWRRGLSELRSWAAAADTVVGIGRPTALAAEALATTSCRWSFYDAMDDFPEFYSGRSRAVTRAIEGRIAAGVDRIFASAPALARKFDTHPNVTLVPNAFDMSLLPRVVPQAPADVCLGFIGSIGIRFDWPLVAQLASAIAPARVVLIGPRSVEPPSPLPANVALEPPCHQPDAIRRLASFSAGLIPFRRTALTESMDPIKYYQYVGAGLPVLSTRFGPMADRLGHGPVVELGGAVDPAAAVAEALARRPSQQLVDEFRARHTWSRRFQEAGLFEVR